ncbi:MAG: cell division/cell wall cluster transcriptional repressor MraZ [Clostridia bacterium]|nr:cell division/cell wall cluster transcriptional repressor MraZ [Clostridia bacterium]
MFFLTGEYDHQIDAKNRIRIPAKLKGNEDKLYFSKGTNGCIFVFYDAAIKEKLEKLETDVKIGDAEKQKGLRAFTKSLKLVEMDPQGRLVIPQELIGYGKIKKDIKICGAGSRIEIWAKEVYEEYFADVDENFDENFGILDI